MYAVRLNPYRVLGLSGLLVIGSAFAVTPGESFFDSMQPNEWVRVPAVGLPRYEAHRGMAVDSTGGRLFLFGSDTHGETTPDNAVHTFDADTLTWTASNAPEPVSNYLIDHDHWTPTVQGNPWASHTFDNLVYLPGRNQLLVMAVPGHNYAGIEAVETTWVAKQTWLYDLASSSWQFLKDAGTPQQNYEFGLYAKGLVYDPNLGKVIGSGRDRTFLFDPATLTWSSVPSNNDGHDIDATAEFNHVTGRSFLFGGVYSLPNRVTAYDPVASQWQEMATTGVTPVNADGAQIAVDTVNDAMIYVSVLEDENSFYNPSGESQTLVLKLRSGEWTIPDVGATPLNFGLGFAMGYLEKYDVSLYLTRDFSRQPQMWAFRYEPTLGDADIDGVFNPADNCRSTANPGQADVDFDGVGDSCDNCISTPNPGQEDDDRDGCGNACVSGGGCGSPVCVNQ